jgi:hypothetical protein
MTARSVAAILSHAPTRPVSKVLLVVPLVLVGALLLAGCSYPVYVRGVQVEAKADIPPGSSINVRLMPDADHSDRDEAILKKIEYMVAKRGYVTASESDAEYILLFRCDLQAMVHRMSLDAPGGGRAGMVTTSKPGPFERSLLLHIVEAPPFRKDQTEQVVWAGSSIIHDAPTDGPIFEDMLVEAAFRHFPVDTGETLKVKLRTSSPSVKRLSRL